MEDIRDKLKKNRLRIVFLLAFIFSLVGAILLLATDFLTWYDYNPYPIPDEYGWINTDSDVYGPIIIMAALFLLICTFISIVGIYNPRFVNKPTLLLGDLLSIIVFLMTIMGIMIAAGDLGEKSSWNPDAGFYGAILGGLLILIFFSVAILFMKQGSIQESKQVSIQESKVSRRITPVKTVQKVIYCHNCGKEVSGEFCTYCGTELRKIQEYKLPESEVSKVNLCPKCGKEVSGEFCTYCGTTLR